MWPTTCFWRERLSSFEFFSFITLKGRLPVKWTAYEALLYGVYTTQSDVWVGNIIRHLRSPCSFFVKYKCSHLPFLLIFSWSYGILLNEILTVGKRGLKHKHTQYCKKKKTQFNKLSSASAIKSDGQEISTIEWQELKNRLPSFFVHR